MSTGKEPLYVEMGKRLAKERRTYGMSQSEYGTIGGVSGKTQGNYERGIRCPDAEYLHAISEYSDINFIVTGEEAETKVFRLLGSFEDLHDFKNLYAAIEEIPYLIEDVEVFDEANQINVTCPSISNSNLELLKNSILKIFIKYQKPQYNVTEKTIKELIHRKNDKQSDLIRFINTKTKDNQREKNIDLVRSNVSSKVVDTPVNMEILQFAIETIETALDKTRATMNPDKKANVVRVAYELFMEAEEKGEEERAKTKSNVIHLMTAMGGN